jgi:hypothetical protein
MVKMMNVLIAKYADRRKIYLSWDAASWHIAKQLNQRIDEHNSNVGGSGVVVETAPLPSGAQFLNLIESVFSGMSRAIIQNSNYPSIGLWKGLNVRHAPIAHRGRAAQDRRRHRCPPRTEQLEN